MNPGDTLTIRQLHADGVCYRWHTATIESVEAILKYGYTENHQQQCWAAVQAGLALAETWQPHGWQPK